jgi:hypothetical protein
MIISVRSLQYVEDADFGVKVLDALKVSELRSG